MRTLALVIGINDYYEGDRLTNAVNDATAIKDVFMRLGYDIIFLTDCTLKELFDAIEEFKSRIQEYDSSIFYFAGHGFQFDGENYLASKECQISYATAYDCRITCLLLSDVLDVFKIVPDNVNIAIIDACRVSFARGIASTFTPIHAPKGTLIAFSTSPGDGASDRGMGNNSVYTGSILQYIGRERLSVEDLFKKVRKSVSTFTGGAKTTWEHTSLTGDFYFNTGQLVYSVSIPYDDKVVKDKQFVSKGNLASEIILGLRSLNWNRQNPAMDKFTSSPAMQFDKNEQFLIGRNILQASAAAHSATNFLDDLAINLKPYTNNGENHVLNGILFEMYFDSKGDFRGDKLKKHHFKKIFSIRKDITLKGSFQFIKEVLEPYRDQLFYIPSTEDEMIDINVAARIKKDTIFNGTEVNYDLIEKIVALDRDITIDISKYDVWGQNELGLKHILVQHLTAPEELITVIANRSISKMAFNEVQEV